MSVEKAEQRVPEAVKLEQGFERRLGVAISVDHRIALQPEFHNSGQYVNVAGRNPSDVVHALFGAINEVAVAVVEKHAAAHVQRPAQLTQ